MPGNGFRWTLRLIEDLPTLAVGQDGQDSRASEFDGWSGCHILAAQGDPGGVGSRPRLIEDGDLPDPIVCTMGRCVR